VIDAGRLRVDGDRDAALRFFELFNFAPRMAPVAGDGERLGAHVVPVATA
jgi:hypothetical protein